MNPLISVIVPVYNTEKYISRCLDSILHNSYHSIEVICVNDGSTDASLQVLRKYEAQDKRVRVINQENGGVSVARNTGLSAAKGEWISFVDSDDWVYHQFFDLLMRIQRNTAADVVGCGMQRVDDKIGGGDHVNVDYKIVTHDEIMNDFTLLAFRHYVWGKIYSRNLIGEHRFLVGQEIAEDTAFNIDVLFQKENLCAGFMNFPLYYYYKREDSAINTKEHSQIFRVTKNVYLPNYEKYPPKLRDKVLEQGIRNLLAARNLSACKKDKNTCSECNCLLKECLDKAITLPVIKRRVYQIFSRIPLTYRIWKNFNDFTALICRKN